jgi:hypothetical protein
MEEINALFNGLSLHNDDRQRQQPQKAQQQQRASTSDRP